MFLYRYKNLFFVHPWWILRDVITHNLDCGGPDLNRRISTEMDSESIAFDQARQPPLCNRGMIVWYFKSHCFHYLIQNSHILNNNRSIIETWTIHRMVQIWHFIDVFWFHFHRIKLSPYNNSRAWMKTWRYDLMTQFS